VFAFQLNKKQDAPTAAENTPRQGALHRLYLDEHRKNGKRVGWLKRLLFSRG